MMESRSKREMVKGSEEERQGKLARVEMGREEKGQFLFLPISGYLMGINLNHLPSSNLNEPTPPLVPTFCSLDLRSNDFPLGMRHFKLGEKLYLLGGINFNSAGEFSGYTKKVYQFDSSHIHSGSLGHLKLQSSVLTPVCNLNEGKCAFVAKVRDTIYALKWWGYGIPCLENFQCVFERYDPNMKSWHKMPSPSFYEDMDVNSRYAENPVISQYVVDDRLFVVFINLTLEVFNVHSENWETFYGTAYESYWYSFCKYDLYPPREGYLELPVGEYSLGVVLCIQPSNVRSSRLYNVYAMAMDKTTGHLKFYQVINGVFFDEEVLRKLDHRPPFFDEWYNGVMWANVLSEDMGHLLDLGKGAQENDKRICAILSADISGISYLFIVILDVQMIDKPTASADISGCYDFLKVSTVKRLVFRLNEGDKSVFISESLKAIEYAWNIPPLDAFLL